MVSKHVQVAGGARFVGVRAFLELTLTPNTSGVTAPTGSEVVAQISGGLLKCHSSRNDITPSEVSAWINGRKGPWCEAGEAAMKQWLGSKKVTRKKHQQELTSAGSSSRDDPAMTSAGNAEESRKKRRQEPTSAASSSLGGPATTSADDDDPFWEFTREEKFELLEAALAEEELVHQEHIRLLVQALKQR